LYTINSTNIPPPCRSQLVGDDGVSTTDVATARMPSPASRLLQMVFHILVDQLGKFLARIGLCYRLEKMQKYRLTK
jgi:hypothetical protein